MRRFFVAAEEDSLEVATVKVVAGEEGLAVTLVQRWLVGWKRQVLQVVKSYDYVAMINLDLLTVDYCWFQLELLSRCQSVR